MAEKNTSQRESVVREAQTGTYVAVSPAQERRIKETIEELRKASRRIDEARRYIRRS